MLFCCSLDTGYQSLWKDTTVEMRGVSLALCPQLLVALEDVQLPFRIHAQACLRGSDHYR
jgi:hypothetical protein